MICLSYNVSSKPENKYLAHPYFNVRVWTSMDIWTWLPALVAGSWLVLSDFWLPASGFQLLATSYLAAG